MWFLQTKRTKTIVEDVIDALSLKILTFAPFNYGKTSLCHYWFRSRRLYSSYLCSQGWYEAFTVYWYGARRAAYFNF